MILHSFMERMLTNMTGKPVVDNIGKYVIHQKQFMVCIISILRKIKRCIQYILLFSDEGSYRRIASQGEFSSSSDESSKLYTSPIGGSAAGGNGGSSSTVPDVLVYNPSSIPKNTPNHVLESAALAAGAASDAAALGGGSLVGAGGGGVPFSCSSSNNGVGPNTSPVAFGFPYSNECHKSEDSKDAQ